MKTFNNCAAQGDVYFIRVPSLPDGLKRVASENGQYIIAHSETSHHHVIADAPNVSVFSTDNPLVSYLQVIEATDEAETVLRHLRSFDTHDPIKFSPGIYRAINQRESSLEGWRRSTD